MKLRKILALVMALCLLAGHLPATAWAAEEEAAASGTCGDDLTWSLDKTGLLTISGTGEMTSAPWMTDYAASITAVHMEPSITSIYDRAFSNCSNLTEVTIPEGVTSIGNSAFYGCLNLPELTLPQSLRTIGKSAFSDCDALTQMVIPEGVTEILLDTFAGCYRLASVTVPSTVTEIDQCAFLSCPSLKSFIFPEGIGIVEFELFMNCYTLESVSIPSSVCVIKACAFQDCDRLGEVTIPDCVFSIGDYAFYKSGLTALRVGPGGEVDRTLGSNTIPAIPDGIGRYSFSSCSYLEEVEIGPEINEIGEYAFAYSSNLTQCTFLGDIPTIDATAFFDVTATVYYPAGNATYTEETMLDYGGDLTWVAYEVETEELFELDGANLELEDGLNMNFFVEPQKVAEGYYAVITRSYADGRADHVVTVPYDQWNSLMGEVFYVTYTGIAAKEMGDTISVVLYNAEGKAVSKTWKDSIQAYALRQLNNTPTESLETLLVDMLNYGAAAQVQFGYNTDDLVNNVLTDAQKACATASYETQSNLVSGTGRAGTTLTLKNRITLDFIFKNIAIGTDYTSLYAIATYTDHYGNEVETRIDTVKVYNANLGYVSVSGLAVADYAQAVTCTVYDAEGNVLAWSTDSIEGYAHRMKGSLPEIVDAIMKFCTSSYNFFH